MDLDGFVKLRIAGDGLNFCEITDTLGVLPDFSYRKGDTYVDKFRTGRVIIYDEDCWLAEVKKSDNETVEECIEKFVLKLYHAVNYLKMLASRFDVTLWISLYPNSEQANFRLSRKTVCALSEMGISVDFDIAFLKEFYDGTY